MTEDKADSKPSFTVTDRRGITEEGTVREDPEPETPAAQTDTAPQKATGGPEAPGDTQGPIDFASFILSLATTAMVHLGEVPDPALGKEHQDLPAARQMVDIIAMLSEKSEGNRTPEETRLIEDILYQLRMKVLAKNNVIKI